MKSEAPLAPGVKVPPPVIYVIALLFGFGLDYLWPGKLPPQVPWGMIGGSIIGVSVAIVPFVLIRFKRRRTSFSVFQSATALITDGPYQLSRNPAYVALTLLYIGIGFFFSNGWMLALCIPVVMSIDRWVIPREERHLEAQFGEAYVQYKTTTRRWV